MFEVPVYDGRKGQFKMSELHRLPKVLPPWTGDNLKDYVCLVGYTANIWGKDNVQNNLSLNIQWVVLLSSLFE
jgi:hypothetical protein